MLLAHGPYVKANFRMLTYGMDEKSETFKKSFPSSFKRYFFRLVKSMTDKKGQRLTRQQVKQRARWMPPTFIIPSGKYRCTLHKISCPSNPCPYATLN